MSGLLGGLFGGGGGGGMFSGTPAYSTTSSQGQSQTNTQVDPGGGYYPLEQSVFGVAQNNILNRPYQAYDVNQRFAGFTPDQQQAFQQIRNAQGSWQPAFNQAQGNYNAASGAAGGVGTAGMPAFNQALGGPGGIGGGMPWANAAGQSWTNPGTAQSWMSPYLGTAMAGTADAANRAFSAPGGPMQQMTDAFTGGSAGQFGRQRMGDVANNLAYNYGQGLSNTLGQMANTGYNQAQSAFNTEQNRYAGLAGTMGQLGLGDITANTGLGTALVGQGTAGVNANINAGAGQTAFGQATQGAQLKDAAALMSSGQQQQNFNQQQADFNYQQFLQQMNWPATNAALAQSLAQGWQLPTQTNTQSSTYGQASQTPAGGSPFGNILGAGLSIAGMGTGGGNTVGGGIANWLGNMFSGGGGGGGGGVYGASTPLIDAASALGQGAARGGHIRAFGAGGYAPVVRSLRQSAQRRQPAQQQRLQAFQQGQQGPMAGMPGPRPMAPPGGPAMPGGPPGGPQQAFARGGRVGMAGGGVLGQILGTAGSLLGNLIPIPVVGPMIGGMAGNALGDLIGGDPQDIGDDVKHRVPVIGGMLARGGHIDEDQDREMMRRAVWAHERAMHDASRRDLTPLRRFAFGGPTAGYAFGGSPDLNDLLLGNADDDTVADSQFLRAQPSYEPQGSMSDWFNQRQAMRTANQRQRAFESSLRQNELQREAEADPGAYWSDFGRQGLRGLAKSTLPLAGIPGSVNSTIWGHTMLPTMSGIDRTIDSAFGEPTGRGGETGYSVGNLLPLAFASGEVAPAVRKGVDWTRRLLSGAHRVGDASALLSAFGDE